MFQDVREVRAQLYCEFGMYKRGVDTDNDTIAICAVQLTCATYKCPR